VQVMIRE